METESPARFERAGTKLSEMRASGSLMSLRWNTLECIQLPCGPAPPPCLGLKGRFVLGREASNNQHGSAIICGQREVEFAAQKNRGRQTNQTNATGQSSKREQTISINQSSNQSINYWINQWINQSISQSVNQSINQSTNQSINQ